MFLSHSARLNKGNPLFSPSILSSSVETEKSYSTLHAADIVHLPLPEASALFSPVPGGTYSTWGVGGWRVVSREHTVFASPITFPRNLKELRKHVFSVSFSRFPSPLFFSVMRQMFSLYNVSSTSMILTAILG